ncbi:hypothetical protein GCM10022237_09120 [Nocardioides ginsengisoli]|uniref:ABM domain-containing protein n=1 Tax=Nocardioides ginsengisoli TaxID=363868 RepID=A0ABW3W201_9ACTN
MSFIQIQDIHLDRADRMAEIDELAAQWRADTAGRRTLLREHAYVDRTDPTHVVVVAEFDSYASAMVNSALPETDAFAARLRGLLAGPPSFVDLEPLSGHDERVALADVFRADIERSEATASAYTDDVAFVGMFPQALVHATGPAELTGILASDGPGHTIETWDVQPTPAGFAAEYRWRTTGETSYLSVGTVLATVTGGRISRLVCTCAGSWDAEAEARITGTAVGVSA